MTPLRTKQAITSQTSHLFKGLGTSISQDGMVSFNLTKNNGSMQTVSSSIPSYNLVSGMFSDAKANITNQRDGSSVKLWIGTQAQYDAIKTKDSTVMYMVTI